MKCFYCSTEAEHPDDLRPYGPDGAQVCFPCVQESPERIAEAKRRMEDHLNKVFDHAEKTGAPVLMGDGLPRTGSAGSETMQ